MPPRRKTRQVTVGTVRIGGDAPVALQSMTSTYTYDVDKTLEQIHRLAAGGGGLRPRRRARINATPTPCSRSSPASPVPIVADVHFHFERALEAIAAGVHKIRLNPGNIQDRAKVRRVIAACKERGIPDPRRRQRGRDRRAAGQAAAGRRKGRASTRTTPPA